MRLSASNALMLAFWLACAAFITWHTRIDPVAFPFVNIDEHAHYSYTMDLLRNHIWWPDFNHFPLTDAATGKPISDPNYLNHPPGFYWLMKLVQEAFPHADPLYYRIPSLVFCLAALAIYARIGMKLALPVAAAVVYALLPVLLYVPLACGYYNNDSMAMFGGALACFGSVCWLQNERRRAFHYLCIGLTCASVKLTALLLIAIYALVFLAQQNARKQMGQLVVLLAVLSIPYLILTLRYGSPAPNTPGQVDWLTYYATTRGWLHAPRMDFLHWLAASLTSFAHQYAGPEVTFAPLLLLVAAFVYFLRPRPTCAQCGIIRAAAVATLLVLALHLGFSWPRYLRYGWIYDMFIRYYFPLLPAYGITVANFYLQLSKQGQKVRVPA